MKFPADPDKNRTEMAKDLQKYIYGISNLYNFEEPIRREKKRKIREIAGKKAVQLK